MCRKDGDVIDRHLLGRRIIVGYNAERTLRYGKREEHGFTAYGVWPLLIGIGKPSDRRQEGVKVA